jgi:type I restriction enzyme S subunit
MGARKRWPTVALRTLGEFRNGVNYNKSNFGNGIKVIGVSDFQDHVRASFDQLEQINPEGVVRKEHLLRDGDILFVRSNGNRELIGRSLFVNGVRENVTHSAFSIRLRFTTSQCCPRFYAYLFRSTLIRQALSMFGGGTNISNLNQGILERLDVPLPPTPTQERIASILSAYDDLIENNTRRIKIIEEMEQMIYREWFVSFRFPGHENVRMIESELGPIPEGWRSGILRDVCESLDYGYTASATSEPIGPKFLRITDIVPSVIDWNSVPYCPQPGTNADRYALREGDIVIARTGATTGYAKRLNKRHPASVFASYLVRLRIKSGFSNHLFGVLVESDEYKRFIKANWSGAAQPQANAQILTSIPIPISPEPLHRQFSEVAEPLLDLKEALQFKNLNLRSTRDFLLPKLISGEVPVEAADEAAAELMEQLA